MLPKFLTPYYIDNKKLVRIGSKYDGGYVVLKKSIYKTNHLITFGICDNFEFEKEFQKLSKCTLNSYDNSIDFNFWLNRLKKDLLKFIQLKIFKLNKLLDIFKYLDFLIFYSKKKNNFFLKKITNKKTKNSICFEDTIDKNIKNFFLKIDIEGYEYEFINQILKFEKNLTGLVIEFHNVERKYFKIKNFIKKLKFQKLIHIHGCTYAGLNNKNIPEVLELTFANINFLDDLNKNKKKKFPIRFLDSPNSKRHRQHRF